MTGSKLLLSVLTVFFSSILYAQGKQKFTKLSSSDLPAGIQYSGKLKEAIRWKDSQGDNIVIISETGNYQNPEFKHDNEGQDAEVFAYRYIITDTLRQVWKVYDFIRDCPVDIQASFIKNTLQVTDFNSDGIAEVWVMYKTVCHGDVSPADMKIIMYQGAQKFAMRGQNKVQLGGEEFVGGEYQFDNAFVKGPKAFREFAAKLWNEHILETWE